MLTQVATSETLFECHVVSGSEEAPMSYSCEKSPSKSMTSGQRLDSPPPDDFLSEALLIQLSPVDNCLMVVILNQALANRLLFLKIYPHPQSDSNTHYHHIKNPHPSSGINETIIPGSTKTHLTNHHLKNHSPPQLHPKSTRLRGRFSRLANKQP